MPTDQGGSSGTRTTVGTVRSSGSAVAKAASKVASRAPSRRRSTRSSGGNRSSGSSGGSSSKRSGGGSSGGGSSRRSSGGSSGGGGAAPKVSTSVIPSLAAYLGSDSVYQTGLSGGKRSLNDYISEIGRRRGEATTQFNQTSASMERDRVRQLEDLKNEFASRGLIQSGLYGEEQGRFQQQFTDQMNALKQNQASLLADLLSQQNNYKRENDLAMQQLKQEAIARRAAKYNIG